MLAFQLCIQLNQVLDSQYSDLNSCFLGKPRHHEKVLQVPALEYKLPRTSWSCRSAIRNPNVNPGAGTIREGQDEDTYVMACHDSPAANQREHVSEVLDT